MKPNAITLSYRERRLIWQVQRSLGIAANRLAHVKRTVELFHHLEGGRIGAFYHALLPENRRYEDHQKYLGHIRWVRENLEALCSADRFSLETGMRLHDIGYAVDTGGNHSEAGYQFLKSNDALWLELGLQPPVSRKRVEFIIRYHGFFTDIDFLYFADLMELFTGAQKSTLIVVNSLDSAAKPIGDKFHSILFSRLLQRYQRFVQEGVKLSDQDRLQQLFGPCNYVWLEEGDFTRLDKLIGETGLNRSQGFRRLLDRAYFWCWPLLKDIVTPEIAIGSSYFTPVKVEYLPQLVNLLAILSRTEELFDEPEKIVIDTAFAYNDLKSRAPILEKLRVDLNQPLGQIKQIAATQFRYGQNITLEIVQTEPETAMIKIGLLE